MKIIVNDNPMEINDHTTMNRLVEFLDFQEHQLAVAINGRVVPKAKWEETVLHENDKIIIIKAVSGG